MVFGRPFIDETGLVYNEEEGTDTFKQDDEKIMIKMPHTTKTFKQTRLMGLSTDSIPPSAYQENFGHGRTHYYQSLLIGDEYKHEEGDRRGIRHLMSDYAIGAVLGQRIDKHFKPIHYVSKTMNEAQENYTTIKKELLAVVFTFDKFRQYLVLSKTIIHDNKGAKNLAADRLSQLENPDLGKLTRAEIRDLFPEERLMAISDKNNEPWYADYANYLASRVLPFRSTRQEKQKFFSDLRHYFWDEPFMFKQCADRIIRICVVEDEAAQILQQCHSGPSRGHHGIATTARKAFQTTFKTPLGTTPFRIIYGKACHLPVELEHKTYWAIKNCNMDLTKAGETQFLQINELDEMQLDAYESSISYKERTKRWHDKRIKLPINYEKGDKVLLFNSRLRLFPEKLKLRWYGPFTVSKDMKNRAIELYDEEGSEFIVNKQRVKPYQKNLLDTNKDDDVTLDDEREVTLYLMRRSLEVLRKFHWMILRGRFNQLSHVSSPLLSKPGEY
ncbi:reverse transcriptase domain-containing protein [Tanacetum coccineum]